MEDAGWTITPGEALVRMTIKYTLYAGRRSFDVDVTFAGNVSGKSFSTGIINVKNSKEYSDRQVLRGCLGIDWPATDTLN